MEGSLLKTKEIPPLRPPRKRASVGMTIKFKITNIIMPQFVVPQFIDVEDKIIGPITTRQFIMAVISVIFIFFAYKFADTALFIIEALIIFGIYILFAFIKINGQNFHIFGLSIIRSLTRPGLRVWKKGFKLKISKFSGEEKTKEQEPILVNKPHPPQKSISSLSLLIDTGGKYRPEEIMKNKKAK